jgi:peptidoglycan/LPS O-acetylase OafA/YrhL
MSAKPVYRPDIDGLRAVAVLGVLFYHYGATWLPGGFTGVDVFFVISGYLITSILLREIEDGNFSVFKFYARRIRRIVPALLVVLLFTVATGYLILLPGDYADVGASTAYAAAGLGNLFFYGNTGYFDQASELQALLHTWSLGVEEQFYSIWPLLLTGMIAVVPRQALASAVLTLTATGFVYAAVLVVKAPTQAFYFPHARAWELGIGAFLVFLPAISNRHLSIGAATLGAVLIAWSFTQIESGDAFPGINAAYACVGAALTIWPKAPTPVERALSLRPVVGVGLISYSLYLWHWPILVLFRHYTNGAMPTLLEAVVLGGASCGLAWMTWRFIERPFRKRTISSSRSISAGLASIAVVAIIGTTLARNDGLPQRVPSAVLAMSSIDKMWKWECPHFETLIDGYEPLCIVGNDWNSATTRMLLWGDSHAEHFAPLFEAALQGSPRASIAIYPDCGAPYGGIVHRDSRHPRRTHRHCVEHRKRVAKILNEFPDIGAVWLTTLWQGALPLLYRESPTESRSSEYGATLMREALVEISDQFSTPNRNFILLGDFPRWRTSPIPCIVGEQSGLLRRACNEMQTSISVAHYHRMHDETEKILRAVSDEKQNMQALIPGDRLCSNRGCQTWVNGEFIYRDDDHIRRNLHVDTNAELAKTIGLTEVIQSFIAQ